MVLTAFYLSHDWKILLKTGFKKKKKTFLFMIFCCNAQQKIV
jgi:hypothetical protein